MIELQLEGAVVELRLGASPCNEIGTTMLAALEGALDAVEPWVAAGEVRALILHSSVRGGFSAGADLRELHRELLATDPAAREAGLRGFIERIHGVMDRLDGLPCTTLGVIHGVCFGGGFELALTCDVLIAEKTARFAFPELRLGIVPGFGGIPRLRREVANPVVRDLLLTGRSINAKKAQQVGLVSQLVPTGEGLPAARAAAAQSAKFDAYALAACKRFMKPIPTAELAAEKQLFVELALRPALQAALQRFVDSDDIRPYLP